MVIVFGERFKDMATVPEALVLLGNHMITLGSPLSVTLWDLVRGGVGRGEGRVTLSTVGGWCGGARFALECVCSNWPWRLTDGARLHPVDCAQVTGPTEASTGQQIYGWIMGIFTLCFLSFVVMPYFLVMILQPYSRLRAESMAFPTAFEDLHNRIEWSAQVRARMVARVCLRAQHTTAWTWARTQKEGRGPAATQSSAGCARQSTMCGAGLLGLTLRVCACVSCPQWMWGAPSNRHMRKLLSLLLPRNRATSLETRSLVRRALTKLSRESPRPRPTIGALPLCSPVAAECQALGMGQTLTP